jgi:hypothetical protein
MAATGRTPPPVALVAAGYGLATIVWIVASGALPGGRWLA